MSRGARFRRALNASQVKSFKPQPGKQQRIADGAGLYLVIDPVERGGSKRWHFRSTIRDFIGCPGKPISCGLGNVQDIPLAQARERAELYRSLARDGVDFREVTIGRDRDGRLAVLDWRPCAAPRIAFHSAFDEYATLRGKRLTSDRYRNQWRRDVERLCSDSWEKDLAEVGAGDIMAAIEPHWHRTPDQARRVLKRLHAFFAWAAARGYRSDDNPCLTVRAGLGPQHHKPERHHASLNWREAPAFFQNLEVELRVTPAVALALRTIMLTASRSREVRHAQWSEINLVSETWTRPGAHMKSNRPHVVPITEGLCRVFDEAAARYGRNGIIFPGRQGGALTDSTLSRPITRSDFAGKITPHGMRATFRSWAADNGHSADAAERQLDHMIGSRTVEAYQRSDLIEQRHDLLSDWDAFLHGER